MFYSRVTKYNPEYRDAFGRYTKNEWTAIGDVGTAFEGVVFTFKKYLFVEDAYVAAIMSYMDCLNISKLRVTELEKHDSTDDMIFDSKTMQKVFYNN